LIQIGNSVPRQGDQIVHVGDLLDYSSEKAVHATVIKQRNRKLEVGLARIREFRYINLSVDAGAMHSLTVATACSRTLSNYNIRSSWMFMKTMATQKQLP
jgi:hypothetical protein